MPTFYSNVTLWLSGLPTLRGTRSARLDFSGTAGGDESPSKKETA